MIGKRAYLYIGPLAEWVENPVLCHELFERLCNYLHTKLFACWVFLSSADIFSTAVYEHKNLQYLTEDKTGP